MDKQRRFEQPIIIGPAACISALDKDLRRFKTNKKLPQRLSLYVASSQQFQALWYGKLLEAWPESDALREVTPEHVSKLFFFILQEVHKHCINVADLEGFLLYYDLPAYRPPPKSSSPGEASSVAADAMELSSNTPELLGEDPMVVDDVPAFLLKSLPMSKDGVTSECCFTVFVEVEDFYLLPSKIILLISEIRKALEMGDKSLANELLDKLNTEDYAVVNVDHAKCLSKKYLIKLRGINTLEIGSEIRDKLVKIVDGKRLTIGVYHLDDSRTHWVGDVYCDGMRLQDKLPMGVV